MLGYRRETLQGALVLAKSGRLELGDNILQISCKAIEFGEKNAKKGYYAVHGDSRPSRSVPVEIKPVCHFLLVINSN